MAKRRIFDTRYINNNYELNLVRSNLVDHYNNKYFNLFMTIYKAGGLSQQAADFFFRRCWDTGGYVIFPVAEEPYVSTFTTSLVDVYGWAKDVEVVNKYNASFFPVGPQRVDRDVVIGYVRPNHKSIKAMVDNYIERLVNIDMVINTNLVVHKMPFVVGVSPADRQKCEDLMQRLLNDDVVIFTELKDLQLAKAMTTNAPYIADKLYAQRIALEKELLTELGIDNAIVDETKERSLVDEVNANNALINLNGIMMLEQIKTAFDKANELFNFKLSIKPVLKTVQSVHEAPKEEVTDNV